MSAATRYTHPKAPAKSRTVSARLSPFTFYVLTLLAKAQRRTMSDVLEWCIHSNSVDHEVPGLEHLDLKQLALETFSTNEIERTVKLGIICPEMLDFEEANVWRVIDGTPELWTTNSDRGSRALGEFMWDKVEEKLGDIEEMIISKADQYPVTGLTTDQITSLGWDLSQRRT